jgi:hypothetical protein
VVEAWQQGGWLAMPLLPPFLSASGFRALFLFARNTLQRCPERQKVDILY